MKVSKSDSPQKNSSKATYATIITQVSFKNGILTSLLLQMPFSYLPILVIKLCNDYMEKYFQQIENELFKFGRD